MSKTCSCRIWLRKVVPGPAGARARARFRVRSRVMCMSACAAAGSTHSKTESHVFTQRASAHGGSGLGATGASRRHSTRECLRLGVGTVLRTQEEESHTS